MNRFETFMFFGFIANGLTFNMFKLTNSIFLTEPMTKLQERGLRSGSPKHVEKYFYNIKLIRTEA